MELKITRSQTYLIKNSLVFSANSLKRHSLLVPVDNIVSELIAISEIIKPHVEVTDHQYDLILRCAYFHRDNHKGNGYLYLDLDRLTIYLKSW